MIDIKNILHNNHILSCIIFLFFLFFYTFDGGWFPGTDQLGNMIQAANLAKHHNLLIDPRNYPTRFIWTYKDSGVNFKIDKWEGHINGIDINTLYERKELKPAESPYYIVKTIHENRYVSSYGIGTPLMFAPFLLICNSLIKFDSNNLYNLFLISKIFSSICSALTLSFIFLASVLLTNKARAFGAVCLFGVTTSLWSINSQSLWQHPASTLSIAISAYYFIKAHQTSTTKRHYGDIALCSIFTGLAVLCRPICVIIPLSFFSFYLISRQYHKAAWFVLCGLPLAFLLGAYNHYCFGSFFKSGQVIINMSPFSVNTGIMELWSTPLIKGMASVMFSPSRGILFLSPVLFFGFWGCYYCFSRKKYHFLSPLASSIIILIITMSKWWCWEGGWCYGYRMLSEIVPLLIILSMPVLDTLWKKKVFIAFFLVFSIWSFIVQFVGVYAVDAVAEWNALPGDRWMKYWNISNSQVIYCIRNFKTTSGYKDLLAKIII